MVNQTGGAMFLFLLAWSRSPSSRTMRTLYMFFFSGPCSTKQKQAPHQIYLSHLHFSSFCANIIFRMIKPLHAYSMSFFPRTLAFFWVNSQFVLLFLCTQWRSKAIGTRVFERLSSNQGRQEGYRMVLIERGVTTMSFDKLYSSS